MNAKNLKHQHNLQVWMPIIHDCKNSGLTVKNWCVQNDVNEKRFYYWQRRVREEILAPAITSKENAATFIQIPKAQPNSSVAFYPDMVLDCGDLRVELKNSVSSDLLEDIIRVIRHV